MNQMEPREAAAFIQGYMAAKRKRTPKWLHPHIRTAGQIFTGGAYNPLDIYEMVSAAKRLWHEAMKQRSDDRTK